MKKFIPVSAALALILAVNSCSNNFKELREGFDCPPADCRPLVWWHWMDGNITKEGIRKDFEWLHRSGISGVFLFDAGMNFPRIVDNRLSYMSPGWKDAFHYTVDLADSLGMTVGLASSPGWSLTGGPWVSEDDAQKKIVWSEIKVEGGAAFHGTLPEPPSVAGQYQDEPEFPNDPDKYRHYRDLYVIAVKCPQADTARIRESAVKGGFKMNYKVSDNFPTPDTDDVTPVDGVIDLTAQYVNGTLDWNVPEGRWKIFRFGYSLLGHVNGPATKEATGLEVDKMDRDAVMRYYDNYFRMYGSALAESGDIPVEKALKGRIAAIEIDSYESGRATWTPKLEEEFIARRGYELRPWLPVLTGQIIGSAVQSEQFLFDWRQTLGELLAENHYDGVNDRFHSLGIARFNEAHEERTAFTGDGMMVKRGADVPMSAFWVRYNAGWYSSYPTSDADVRESSSVAHIFGQNVCAAESFTTNGRIGKWDGFGAYQCHPGNLKPVADMAMACGLNKYVIHTSVHQPVDDRIPGLGLGSYGQWFNRHDTWAEEAKIWTDYLSRSCFLLRQGRYVADIAYFYGEDKNITGRFMDERVEIPRGYNFDFVNGDIILNVFKLKGNRLVTGSGMEYTMLRIDPKVKYMSMPVLKKIAEFARAGVTVCGPKPLRCANLVSDADEFRSLADEVWNLPNVSDGAPLTSLKAANIQEDISSLPDSVEFIHRKIDGGDIYWIANISAIPRQLTLGLRATARSAEIWHADTGAREATALSAPEGKTSVTLNLERDDAQFIILSKGKSISGAGKAPKPAGERVCTIDGPWELAFQAGRGAPEKATFGKLASFTDSEDEGIRYFSGTVTYTKHFNFSGSNAEEPLWIDLGKVCEMARVNLNGTDLGLAWKMPYRLYATGALRQGDNELKIEVTNSWANRLIGDEQPSVTERITYTSHQFYTAGSPLVQSGLIGPVCIVR